MASMVPCPKNTAGYVTYISLVSQADTKIFKAAPTLAAGDFKIAIDDGAPADPATLPVVDADYTKRVKVVLSQAETNGDNLTIICSDAAGAEWCDLTINIQTAAQTLDATDVVADAVKVQTDKLAFTVANKVDSNVYTWNGTAVSAPSTAGIVEVNVKNIANAAVNTATAQVGCNVVSQANIDFGALQKESITAAVPSIALIVDGVWDELVTGHDGAGKAGAQLWTDVDAILADTDVIGATGQGLTSLATPTNITAGTITTVTNLTNAPTVGDLTAAMKSSVTTAVPTATAIGTDAAGKVLVTPAQKLVTNASGHVTLANGAHGGAATVLTLQTPIAANTTLIEGADATDTIGTATAAGVVTALTAANTELATVPTTTSGWGAMIQWLFQGDRNKKTVTATTETRFKEDATTVLGTAALSDDNTTFTKGEFA